MPKTCSVLSKCCCGRISIMSLLSWCPKVREKPQSKLGTWMRKCLSREWDRDDYWLCCPTFKLGVCRSVLSRMMANERIKTVSADLSLETRAGLQWQYLSEKTSTNLSIFWASPGIRKWVWNFLKATSTYLKQWFMKRRLFSNKVGTITPDYRSTHSLRIVTHRW